MSAAASLIFKDLLKAKQNLQAAASTEFGSREEILALRAIAGDISVLTEKLAQASRPCPGLYWRNQDVIDQYNNVPKRHKKMVKESNACRTSKNKPRNFSRNQVGPGGGDGSEIGICNNCAEVLKRDRKNGVCK